VTHHDTGHEAAVSIGRYSVAAQRVTSDWKLWKLNLVFVIYLPLRWPGLGVSRPPRHYERPPSARRRGEPWVPPVEDQWIRAPTVSRGLSASVGVAFLVLAGVGGILVGLAPANVNLAVHGAGALLQVPGAAGPLLLGVAAWRVERPVRSSPCSVARSGRLRACCTSAGATSDWATVGWSTWPSTR
jgi:hypothetical protein